MGIFDDPYFKERSAAMPAVGSLLLMPSASMVISDGRRSMSAEEWNHMSEFDGGQRLSALHASSCVYGFSSILCSQNIVPLCPVNSSSVFCGTLPGLISQFSGVKV